ncbi:MAG: hypothetical protein QOH02_1381, partial [Gaiellaceae bacterium]|nr:hypothetical protein [Gaiellaceae bacterium]
MSFSLFKPGLRSRRLGFRAATGTALFALLVAGILTTLVGGAAAAATPVGLGTAGGYAILAGSGMTNTGPSTIAGDVGSSPTHSETGFARCPGPADCVVLNGTNHNAPDPNDLATQNAQADLITAYNTAAGEGPTSPISDISNQSLDPGVYNSGSTILLNGAQPCNVFWQIGSSATLGAASTFAGSILALTSITMNDAVTVNGRALARNGAVTLINDTITPAACATPGGATPGGTSPGAGGGGATLPGGTVNGGASGTGNGSAVLTTSPRTVARTITRFGLSHCIHGTFRAVVTGRFIRRVVFSQGGRVI